MTPYECTANLKDLCDAYGLKDDARVAWCSLIYKACVSMKPDEFKLVCESLFPKAGNYKATNNDFWNEFRKLEADGKIVKEKHEAAWCDGCGGTKYVAGYHLREEDGLIVMVVVGCLMCQSSRFAPVKGWREVDERDFVQQRSARFFEAWKLGKQLGTEMRAGRLPYQAALTVADHTGAELRSKFNAKIHPNVAAKDAINNTEEP